MTTRFAAAVAAVLLVAGCGAATYNEGDTTDDTTVTECGETGACEGSATTEHPGCDVPGVAVFDLDGRPICDPSNSQSEP